MRIRKLKQWPQDHTQLVDIKAGTQTKLYLPTPRAHMIRNGGAGCSDLSAGLPHSTASPGWSSETLQDIKKNYSILSVIPGSLNQWVWGRSWDYAFLKSYFKCFWCSGKHSTGARGFCSNPSLLGFLGSQKHRSSPALHFPQVTLATESIIHSFQIQGSAFIEHALHARRCAEHSGCTEWRNPSACLKE